MITQKDVAEKAGVSRRTVDRVINNRGSVDAETAQRVRRVIEELDYHPNQAGQALVAKKRNLRLMFFGVKGKNSVVHEEILKGAKKKAAELERFGVKVEFCIYDRDCPMDEKKINEIIDNFHYDGLAVFPDEASLMQQLIEKAEEKEIPVVFYNLDNENYKRRCYVGCNYIEAGRMAAGLVGLYAKGSGQVCAFNVCTTERSLGAPSYKERVLGFEKGMSCYPENEVVGYYSLGTDIFEAYDKAKEVIEQYPDLDAIYIVNPGNYDVCKAIRKAIGKRNIRLITNDLTKESKPLLKDRVISAIISQDAQSQGSMPLQILFDELVYGKETKQDFYYTKLSIYIPESL